MPWRTLVSLLRLWLPGGTPTSRFAYPQLAYSVTWKSRTFDRAELLPGLRSLGCRLLEQVPGLRCQTTLLACSHCGLECVAERSADGFTMWVCPRVPWSITTWTPHSCRPMS